MSGEDRDRDPWGRFHTEGDAREAPGVQDVYDAFGADPGPGKMAPHIRRFILDPALAGRVETGAFEDRQLDWLCQWGPDVAVVVARLVRVSHENGRRSVLEGGGDE